MVGGEQAERNREHGRINYSTRQEITEKRKADMYQRIRKFAGKASKMIKETYDGYRIDEDHIFEVIREYQKEPDKKPSEWFASKDHKGLDRKSVV